MLEDRGGARVEVEAHCRTATGVPGFVHERHVGQPVSWRSSERNAAKESASPGNLMSTAKQP